MRALARRSHCFLLAASFVWGWGGEASATPAALFGAGPRSQARAGLGAASERGVEAVALNPANLGGAARGTQRDAERPQFLLGYRAARFELEAEPLPATHASAASFLFGFTLPIALSESTLTLGLLSAAPDDLLVRAHLPLAETPHFPLLLDRAHALDFALGAGLGLGAPGHGFGELGLGVGLRGLASLSGRARVSSGAAGDSDAQTHTTLDPELAPVLGLAWQPSRSQRLALVGRGALSAEFEVDVSVGSLGSVALPELTIGGVSQYEPAELVAEWASWFGEGRRTRGALGLAYRRWSDFPGWLSPTVSCLDPDCTALPREAVVLADTLVPRVGLEHSAAAGDASLHWRAGYAFEASPLDPQRGPENRWDNARHVLGLGYGVELPRAIAAITLDLAYQLHALVPRLHEKSSSVPPHNPGFPRVTTRGFVHAFALSVGGAL